MSERSLTALLDNHRVVLCVGCGGVGKTTTSAALALAAARRGKRVLCLTIDPAKRLANALGLQRMDSEAKLVDKHWLASHGTELHGSLTVMMLDTKRTFDDLVVRHAPNATVRDRILGNRIYQHLSTRLAGTQEYMAMEKLLALERDPNFDLIVLDTPPTSNALDFLDAPERLVEALDSPAIRWFIQAFGESHRLRLAVVARGAAFALRGIARLVGSGFTEQLAEFLTEIDQLFGGFKERAQAVSAAFRSDRFAYVLVTSPAPDAIREVAFFAERLRDLGLRRDAFVVNRVHPSTGVAPSVADVQEALAAALPGVIVTEDWATRTWTALNEAEERARRDRQNLTALDAVLVSANGSSPPRSPTPIRVEVPALPSDVHDVGTLSLVAAVLCP
jgi:anion-transporting  ArsA/GET3 family ATPase